MTYNPRHWASHLFLFEGSMVREILGRVSICVIWSAIIVVVYDYAPESFHRIAIAQTAHSLLGASLGLLLVFRTNSSYDRFWEGRKQWGGIVNETRNLARQAESWLTADPQRMRQCLGWGILLPLTIMHRLRGTPCQRTLEVLPADELAAVQQSRNVPLAVARKLTQLIHGAQRDGLIDTQQLRAFDQNIQLLIDYIGACERIKSTPMPYAYVVHLRRCLMIYCLTLPLALIQQYGWESIVVTLITSYTLFGIEEIGVEIENPFGTTVNDLQLEVICNTINGDLLWILECNQEQTTA